MVKIDNLKTENRNSKTENLDALDTSEILKIMNEEDSNVLSTIKDALDDIDKLIKQTIKAYKNGGRIIYLGAGTSGRLGLMDAVEVVPTFNSDRFVGLIAGGDNAFVKAVEGAEDSKELAVKDLKNLGFNEKDFLIGIAASGRTPYVIGGIEYAKEVGCITGCIVNAKGSVISKMVNYPVEAITGQEVISGSTRMKSGTAQKLICNMISTSVMVKLGHVYQNLMIDLKATNEKLVARQLNIIQTALDVTKEEASELLKKYQTVKKAIYAKLTGIESLDEVTKRLAEYHDNLPLTLKEYR